jgi:hypothetical protein
VNEANSSDIHAEKADGRQRPLGVPVLEDKLVQPPSPPGNRRGEKLGTARAVPLLTTHEVESTFL